MTEVSHLCSLLSHLEDLDQKLSNHPHTIVYDHSFLLKLVENVVPACNFVQKTDQLEETYSEATVFVIHDADVLYKLGLLKKCILIEFQLLCTTETTAECASKGYRDVMAAAELFNLRCTAAFKQSSNSVLGEWLSTRKEYLLTFAEFVEVHTSSRCECVVDKLFRKCSTDDEALGIAEHETDFIRYFVNACVTGSSILGNPSSGKVVPHL